MTTIPSDTETFRQYIKDKDSINAFINSFNLTSDRFMSKALENKIACQEIINIILDRDDIIVDDVITQYNIPNIEHHGVRLDVLCHDIQGNIYEIEIQNIKSDGETDVRRVRYIQGSIDTSILATSSKYSTLPNLYIIFISNYDPIGDNRAIYHVLRIVEETGKALDNGVYEVYLNLKQLSDNERLRELQQFIVDSRTNYSTYNFPELAKRITYIKSTKGGQEEMCEIMDKLEEMYYKVGHEDGHEEGRVEGIINLIVTLKELNISKEETSEKLKDKFNLDDERIDDYMNLYWN